MGAKELSKSDPPRRFSRRKFIAGALFACAGLAVGADAIAFEPKRLKAEKLRFPIGGLGKSFDGYRIAFLSDFHYPNCIDDDFILRAFRMAKSFGPDLIVLGGDFIHCASREYRPGRPVPDLSGAFGQLSAPDGVVAVLGNHDHWFNAPGIREALRPLRIELIENRHLAIERGGSKLAIVGTGDFWEGEIELPSAFAGIAPETPRILLQHNPDFAEVFPAGYRVDLQLSGHTHGGQVCVPLGPALILPSRYGSKYRAGLVQGPRHPVYVTRGIGVSSPIPLRFCCPPEVTLIELTTA
jgi:predicted MPP superfamily phosphohydrolase